MVKNKKNAGKGSSGKRTEKRRSKFTPQKTRSNILREDRPEGQKRKRADDKSGEGFGMDEKKKRFKQGAFARPDKAARPKPPPGGDKSQPTGELSKRDLKELTEARKAKRKPHYTAIQARPRLRWRSKAWRLLHAAPPGSGASGSSARRPDAG
jgi:hypothetical protein